MRQLIKQQNVEGPDASTVPEASPPLGVQVPAWYARAVSVLLPRGRPAGTRSKQAEAEELTGAESKSCCAVQPASLKTLSVAEQALPVDAPHAQAEQARWSSKPAKTRCFSGYESGQLTSASW